MSDRGGGGSISTTTGPQWRTIAIADGTPAVEFARAGGDRAAGSFAAFVRFPPGWSRPHPGRYEVEEELLVLEGALEMSGAVYRAGDHAFFPPGFVRTGSRTPLGALVAAFFSGPADWTRLDEAASVTTVPPLASGDVAPRAAPIGARARLLREHSYGATWLVDGPLAARAPRDMSVEVLSLPTAAWALVDAGAPIPEMQAPMLCRLRRVDPDLSDI
jgi:hypothetical protein